jgi:hypothetical protein
VEFPGLFNQLLKTAKYILNIEKTIKKLKFEK